MIPFAWPFVALSAICAAFVLVREGLLGLRKSLSLRVHASESALKHAEDVLAKFDERIQKLEAQVRELGMRS